MTDAVKLKPCPFCGGDDLSTGGDDKFVGIFCKTCKVTGPNHYGSLDWNTRAEPAPSPDAVKIEPVGSYQLVNGQVMSTTDFYPYGLPYPDGDLLLYGPDAMDRIKELEEIKAEYVEFMKEVEEREETFARMIGDQMERAEKAEARLAEAMKAMEPFAKASEIKLCGEWRDDQRFAQTDVGFHLTFGHLRAARRALTGGQKDG